MANNYYDPTQQAVAPQQNPLAGLLNNPLTLMGLSLLATQDESVANILPGIAQFQQAQIENQHRQAQAAQQAKEFALREKQFYLESEKYQNQLDQQNRQLKAGTRLAELRGNKGQTPEQAGFIFKPDSKVYTGSGLLGGQLTPQEHQLQVAEIMAEAGEPVAAANIIREQGQFFQPTTGIDESGQPVYFQVDRVGNKKIIQGVTPESTAQKELAKQDAQNIGKLREQAAVARQAFDTTVNFENKLKETNPIYFGPVAGKVAPYISSNSQELRAYSNQMALLARKLYELPASGFSDADRDFLVKSVYSIEQDPSAALSLANKIKGLAGQAFQRLDTAEQKMSGQSSTNNSFPTQQTQQFNAQNDPLGYRSGNSKDRLGLR